jgi:hypothetical protein
MPSFFFPHLTFSIQSIPAQAANSVIPAKAGIQSESLPCLYSPLRGAEFFMLA